MNIERIATLLASGLTAAQVATIVGVSPARISQIQKEPDFAEIFTAKQIEVQKKDIEEVSLTAKYTSAEHLLIDQMMQMAPVSELRDVTAALRVVAERQEKAKSRMNPVIQAAPTINNIVQLTLPAHAVPEIAFNQEKEVTAIGNRDLAPLSSTGVLSLFGRLTSTDAIDAIDAISDNRNEGDSHVPARISGSSTEDDPKALPLSKEAIAFLDSREAFPA